VRVESFTGEEISLDGLGNPTPTSSTVSICEKRLRHTIVDLRINETLQIGAVGNSAYQTWRAKVFR